MDGGSADDKPCDRDSMEIFSTGTKELGMNKLCGKNEGQHIYVPVESVQVRDDGDGFNNLAPNRKY